MAKMSFLKRFWFMWIVIQFCFSKLVCSNDECNFILTLSQTDYLYSTVNTTPVCAYDDDEVYRVDWFTRETDRDVFELAFIGFRSGPGFTIGRFMGLVNGSFGSDSSGLVAPGFEGHVGGSLDDVALNHTLFLLNNSLYIGGSFWRCETIIPGCSKQNMAEIQLHFRGNNCWICFLSLKVSFKNFHSK